MGNFMRLPHATSAEGLDFAIVGIPFDTAASFRAGARFGPNGVRNISAMIKPNNVAMGVNIMDSLKGADLGDVPVIPDYIHETYAAIEQTLDGVLECGAVPISIGGDHAITLGELRAIAKKHGKVSLVHFDSHLDLCDTVFGQKYNHGTPFRRAMEEGLIDPEKSVQIGMKVLFTILTISRSPQTLASRLSQVTSSTHILLKIFSRSSRKRLATIRCSLHSISTLLTRLMHQVQVLLKWADLLPLKHFNI